MSKVARQRLDKSRTFFSRLPIRLSRKTSTSTPRKDFKVHVQTNLLVYYSDLACDFLELDPRGAHVGQLVMQDAVRKAIWDADLQPKLLSNTLALGKPIEEVVAVIAYKLRGLLAHYRLKYDNHTPGLPAPWGLENVFDRMQAPSHSQPSSKRARKMERLSSRPHPFAHFRSEERHQLTPTIQDQTGSWWLVGCWTSVLMSWSS